MIHFQRLNRSVLGIRICFAVAMVGAYLMKNFTPVDYALVLDAADMLKYNLLFFALSAVPVFIGYFLLRRIGWVFGMAIYAVAWVFSAIAGAKIVFNLHSAAVIKAQNVHSPGWGVGFDNKPFFDANFNVQFMMILYFAICFSAIMSAGLFLTKRSSLRISVKAPG